MIELKPNACKCGGKTCVFISIRQKEPQYQGEVECQDCGETVRGGQWHYDKDHAAEDAVEEWNKKMGEQTDD